MSKTHTQNKNKMKDLPHSVYHFQRHDEMHAKNVVIQEVQWDHMALV